MLPYKDNIGPGSRSLPVIVLSISYLSNQLQELLILAVFRLPNSTNRYIRHY